MQKIYARIIDGKVVEFPVSALHITNRAHPMSWYTEVKQDNIPAVNYDECTQGTLMTDGVNCWMDYIIVKLPPDALMSKAKADGNPQYIEKAFDNGLVAHLDAVAATKGYDNRITCAMRAGFTGPYQVQGQTFAAWMDTCYQSAFALMTAVNAGTTPMPEDVQKFIETLPAIVW